MKEIILTFLTIISLITSIADADTHNADAVSSTVNINALFDWNITLGAFPSTVALTTTMGVLAICTAQNWTGSWAKYMQENKVVRQLYFID